MAMNTTMMADSGGRSSGGLSDMDVNAESFYVGYKLLEQLNSSLDSFKSSVMAVDESLVSSVGCSFSSAKSKATKMRADLDILYRNMVKFKETLERIDSSNAALFASLDSQMSGGFGEEMSETDYALMLEELKKIYNEAKSKNQSELTDYEKQVIAAYEPYAKLEEYNSGLVKLDDIEESLKEKRSELNICTMMASHGAGSKSNSEKMTALSKDINELSAQKKALKSSNKELRAYLLDNGLVEPTGLESIKAAGATLFESGKEAVSAIFSGDKDALNKVKDFAVELKATGAVVQNSITSGVLKLGEYIIDGAEIIVTTGNSIFTGAFDLLKKAYCKVTGAEYTSTTKAMWADTMADVEIDRVGELNKLFYTQTELGKYINEKSALKYDSTGAKLVQNVTTKAAEIVGATVATVATGGAAAPFVAAAIGFTEGVGKTGEEQFAAGNKDAKGVLLSYLGGVGKAAEWYGYGQMGSNVVSAVNKLRTVGASAAANTASKEVLNKTINENLFKKAIGKTFTTADVYLDTAAAGANAVSTRITTGKWNAGEMALDFGLAVGGNVVGDILSGLADKKAAKKALSSLAEVPIDELPDGVQINEFGEIIRGNGGLGVQDIDPDIPTFTPPGDGSTIKGDELFAGVKKHDADFSDSFFKPKGETGVTDMIDGVKKGDDLLTSVKKHNGDLSESFFKTKGENPGTTPGGYINEFGEIINKNQGVDIDIDIPTFTPPEDGNLVGITKVVTSVDPGTGAKTKVFSEVTDAVGVQNISDGSKSITDAIPTSNGLKINDAISGGNRPDISDAAKVVSTDAAGSTFELAKQKELLEQHIKIQQEAKAITTNITTPGFADKADLLMKKNALEQQLLAYAHSKGITFEDYVKGCGKIDQLDEATQKIVNKYAHKIFESATAAEEEISAMMKSLEIDGAQLEGFSHRFKKEDSIARKIASGLFGAKDEASISYLADQINDSLRYTLIVDEGNYRNQVLESLHKLLEDGYQVQSINNKWGSSVYQGLNTTLVSPSGTVFELQFHTADSFKVKELLNHQYYEISRSVLANHEQVKAATEIMKINQALYVRTIDDMVGLSTDDIVKQATFKEWTSYDDFVKHYRTTIDTWKSQLTDHQKMLFANYIGNGVSDPGSYSSVNNLQRGLLIDADNQIITVIDTFTTGEGAKYSFADFEKYYLPVKYKGRNITTITDWIDMQYESFNEIQGAIGSMQLDEGTLLYRGVNMNALTCLTDANGVSLGIKADDSIETIFNKLKGLDAYVDKGFMSTSPVPTPITTSKDVVFKLQCKKGANGIDMSAVGGFENEFLLAGGQAFDVTGYGTEMVNGIMKNIIYLTLR